MTEEPAALHRRRFLKGVVIAGGATIAAPASVQAQAPEKPNGNASSNNLKQERVREKRWRRNASWRTAT